MNTSKFYDGAYKKRFVKPRFWSSPSEEYSWYSIKNSILTFFKEERDKLRKKIDVLDFGCGMGTDIFVLNHLFSKKNISFVGVDISQTSIRHAKFIAKKNNYKNCKFLVGNLENKDVVDKLGKKFDIIISSEVIEHLKNVNAYIENISDLLKEDGELIISTPNKNHTFKRLFRKFLPKEFQERFVDEMQFFAKCDLEKDISHISVQTPDQLKLLLANNGINIEKIHRGALVYGGRWFDKNPLIFGALTMLDALLPRKFFINLGWDFVIKARKGNEI